MIKKSIIGFVLIICSLLSACQPTPDQQIVANKGGNNQLSSQGAKDTPAAVSVEPTEGTAKADVTEKWMDSFTVGNNRIDIDADVAKHEDKKIAVYTFSYTDITQEQVTKFADYFFKGIEVFTNASEILTKDDYSTMIVQKEAELFKWEGYDNLSKQEQNELNPAGSSPEQKIAAIQEELAKLKEEYKNAPETASKQSAEPVLENGKLELIIQEKTIYYQHFR